MSWSLEIANGDLSIGGPGLNTVSGSAKAVQDLRCALLEPMGTDPITPSYGSILDGGVDTDGVVHAGFIGTLNDPTTAALVESEIKRIISVYQAQQIARNDDDIAVYGKSTLTVDEAIIGITNTDMTIYADTLSARITLQTGANTELPIGITLDNGVS